MNQLNEIKIDFLLDKMAINLHMLGAFMEGRISRKMDDRLVIAKDHSRNNDNLKVLKQGYNPCHITCHSC